MKRVFCLLFLTKVLLSSINNKSSYRLNVDNNTPLDDFQRYLISHDVPFSAFKDHGLLPELDQNFIHEAELLKKSRRYIIEERSNPKSWDFYFSRIKQKHIEKTIKLEINRLAAHDYPYESFAFNHQDPGTRNTIEFSKYGSFRTNSQPLQINSQCSWADINQQFPQLDKLKRKASLMPQVQSWQEFEENLHSIFLKNLAGKIPKIYSLTRAVLLQLPIDDLRITSNLFQLEQDNLYVLKKLMKIHAELNWKPFFNLLNDMCEFDFSEHFQMDMPNIGSEVFIFGILVRSDTREILEESVDKLGWLLDLPKTKHRFLDYDFTFYHSFAKLSSLILKDPYVSEKSLIHAQKLYKSAESLKEIGFSNEKVLETMREFTNPFYDEAFNPDADPLDVFQERLGEFLSQFCCFDENEDCSILLIDFERNTCNSVLDCVRSIYILPEGTLEFQQYLCSKFPRSFDEIEGFNQNSFDLQSFLKVFDLIAENRHFFNDHQINEHKMNLIIDFLKFIKIDGVEDFLDDISKIYFCFNGTLDF